MSQSLHLAGRCRPLGSLVSVVSVLCLASFCPAGDWAHWRGPEQNGVSREQDLPDRFSLDANDPNSNLIWHKPYGGRSAPLVMNGRVFLINDAGEGLNEQERVMCFDAQKGDVLWEHKFNVFHTDIVSDRVGWTNLAGDPETGNVYAQGVQGLLLAFDRDGKLLWSHSLTEEYGRISGYGGRVTSPTVDGDLVIVGLVNASWGDQGRPGNRYLALDKSTGIPVWWSDVGPFGGTYYSVPVVAVINGERLLITGGCDGYLHALRVRTGEQVWKYQVGARAINSSPVVEGTRVYISHGEENVDTNEKGRVVCVDAGQVDKGQPRLIWKANNIKAGYASPIIHEGRLYVADDTARLYCLDAETGKPVWRYKYGTAAKGSPVWADGKIYVPAVNSQFCILRPGDKTCEIIYKQTFRNKDGADVEINGSPAVANGRVYFMTSDELYCIGKKDRQAGSVANPPRVEDPPADASAKPAHLQVVPADAVVHPGEKVDFKARLFDEQGRFLREVKAEWKLAAMLPPAVPIGAPPAPKAPAAAAGATPPLLQGQLTADGQFAPAKTPPSQFGGIVATAEGLTGRARVRVAPNLPYAPNFNNIPVGRTPGGWVNCQGKFAIKEKDGVKVLAKLNTNPFVLISRAYAFMGMPSLTNYTIQADLMGTRKREDLPDMGIVANRYTLMLDGNKQQLRLLSWEAVPRVDKSIAFGWKENTWYRMKFTVDVQGGKATVRGKVWPRDQTEPEDWTVTFEDPTANREGSPGVYGYAAGIEEDSPGTEIFYDKVAVTPNK
jgi:outer membrane protein assembly factor BamB